MTRARLPFFYGGATGVSPVLTAGSIVAGRGRPALHELSYLIASAAIRSVTNASITSPALMSP